MVLGGLSTCHSAESCALALQAEGEVKDVQKAKQERCTASLVFVCQKQKNDERKSMFWLREAACKRCRSGRLRPRKRRSERCDKHLDHMTLTTRLPSHVSVDFCHAQTCAQLTAALRDATVFFFSFRPKASRDGVSCVAATLIVLLV